MELKHQRPADVVLDVPNSHRSTGFKWGTLLWVLKEKAFASDGTVRTDALADIRLAWDAVTTPGKTVVLSDGSRVSRKEDQ